MYYLSQYYSVTVEKSKTLRRLTPVKEYWTWSNIVSKLYHKLDTSLLSHWCERSIQPGSSRRWNIVERIVWHLHSKKTKLIQSDKSKEDHEIKFNGEDLGNCFLNMYIWDLQCLEMEMGWIGIRKRLAMTMDNN